MPTLDDIIHRVNSYYPSANTDLIKKGYEFAEKQHEKQVRKSGEPYLQHPVEVAIILTELKMDVSTIVTALLHDTVEDTGVALEVIKKEFGEDVANLVDGVTKIGKIRFRTTQEKQAENFRKMLLAMAKDLRVIIIKLADRMHNMRTLQYLPSNKQVRIAQETLDIYAPLANRLGIAWIRSELEDLSLRYVKPEIYEKLVEKVAKRRAERETYINKVSQILRQEVSKHGLKAEVSGRPKNFYSIYKKMESRNLEYEQIYDIVAYRIVVGSIAECYEVLGLIHSIWKPIPGRFKDYIAMPKANGYQSLHTTVIGPDAERIEIQIRTKEMHDIAERGVAAHWIYKEGHMAPSELNKFRWLRSLVEFHKELRDSTEFLDVVKVDLSAGDVYVFTPRGDVVELPPGATPLDFAYNVHTDVGNRCVGAKVNGRIVPLKYNLKSGDTIEILTSQTQQPKKDWLNIVQTSRAKSKIRQYIKQIERVRSIELGIELLEKEFRKKGTTFQKLQKQGELEKVAKEMNYQDIDGLVMAVGYGFIPPKQVIRKLFPPLPEKSGQPLDKSAESVRGETRVFTSKAIKIKGVGDVLVRFAKCCVPVPGDPISGFITRGRGVSVHRADCSRLLSHDEERRVEIEWEAEGVKTERNVKVRVLSIDIPGILVKMSEVFGSHGINIVKAQIRTTKDKKAINIFEVSVTNLPQLQELIKEMEGVEGVISVERL
ncbi:MAG: GTP pyrophosphokinase [Deltaproteobacteria bacterium RIFCSPHIGHO2_12_FULL_43_9]|nr:MAG: GTP pyrophosphokinase [Deltaproteobacteria bacterium RIFCSPHIGHO2_12_FULL_43_9]